MVAYREVQRFRETTLCWAVVALHLQTLLFAAVVVLGGGASVVETAVVCLALTLPLVPVAALSLVTEVDEEDGVVRIRIAPFPWTRTIPLADLAAVEPVDDFSVLDASLGVDSLLPWRESATYCLATPEGVSIRLRDRREIRLGSRQPAELLGRLDRFGTRRT
ncbi:hypothetical protein [Haloprofundus halobius]|uniref:hypothetical protein n=1 Tax=Haloprofundus halobius TaxID=2876194 RepID=UPI001CCB998F|nr:hypothetical protein [Haloprofundus halobius]